MRNTTISHLVNELEKCKLCGGVTATELTAKLYHHVVLIVNDQIDSVSDYCQFPNEGHWRMKGCSL